MAWYSNVVNARRRREIFVVADVQVWSAGCRLWSTTPIRNMSCNSKQCSRLALFQTRASMSSSRFCICKCRQKMLRRAEYGIAEQLGRRRVCTFNQLSTVLYKNEHLSRTRSRSVSRNELQSTTAYGWSDVIGNKTMRATEDRQIAEVRDCHHRSCVKSWLGNGYTEFCY